MSENETLFENQKQQLAELDSFVQSTDIELENILSTLGWKVENLDTENANKVVCPFNPGHRLPEKSLEQHLINCQWRAEGYDKFDVALSESTLPPDAPSTIKMDEDLQAEILLAAKKNDPTMISAIQDIYSASLKIGVGDRLIPRTSDRIFIDFTCDERKAIYDYIVANTQKVDIGHDIADLNKTKAKDDQKSISYLELLAQERNLKRRRAKHRGVHTNKKSHVEVMREVIEQQMEMFKEYLAEQNPQDERREASQEITNNFSKNLRMSEVPFEMKYSSDRDAKYFQRFEKNGRYDCREDRREHSHHSDRKNSHHLSHKRDRHRSSEDRHRKRHKHRDSSRGRDRSKDRKRNRSKDRHRNRSREHRESRHDDRRDRKRSRSKHRR